MSKIVEPGTGIIPPEDCTATMRRTSTCIVPLRASDAQVPLRHQRHAYLQGRSHWHHCHLSYAAGSLAWSHPASRPVQRYSGLHSAQHRQIPSLPQAVIVSKDVARPIPAGSGVCCILCWILCLHQMHLIYFSESSVFCLAILVHVMGSTSPCSPAREKIMQGRITMNMACKA